MSIDDRFRILPTRSARRALVLGGLVCSLASSAGADGSFRDCTHVLHDLSSPYFGDARFGFASVALGDLDGDGTTDFAVSTPFDGHGHVTAFSGRTASELWHVDGDPLAFHQRLGFALAPAGDVDGDGRMDLIAGAVDGPLSAPEADVFSGATGQRLLRIRIDAGEFGYVVSGAGDVNGDGVPDLAIGAPLDASAGTDAGAVYVVSGADGATVLHTLSGQAGERLGTAVADVGDLNGDGRHELLVGAADGGPSRGGMVYVFDLATDALVYPALRPDAAAQDFGDYFACLVGDVDADGRADFALADPDQERTYVFSAATGACLFSVLGGTGAASSGDVNGDGRSDVAVGDAIFTRVRLVSGADGSVLRSIDSSHASFGISVTSLGDADGDGRTELLVGASDDQNFAGRALVLAAPPLEDFGVALAGSGGRSPVLALSGCPRPGELVSFETTDVVGNARGSLVVGTRRVDRPVRGGILYPDLAFFRLRHVAAGASGVAGAGRASLPVSLPLDPALLGMRFYAQAFYFDRGAPQGLSFTRGLTLQVY